GSRWESGASPGIATLFVGAHLQPAPPNTAVAGRDTSAVDNDDASSPGQSPPRLLAPLAHTKTPSSPAFAANPIALYASWGARHPPWLAGRNGPCPIRSAVVLAPQTRYNAAAAGSPCHLRISPAGVHDGTNTQRL